jgi:hypothetical protein
LTIFGMKNEKANSATEKNTFPDNSPLQSPLAHTSLTVPTKKVNMKTPTMMPSAVPKK